jgi:hypothetical protein
VSYNYYSCIPNNYWNFVPYRYITRRNVYNHCVSRPRVVHVIHHTTIVTHNHTDNRKRSYFTGPSRSDIERRSNQRVEVYRTNDRHRSSRSDVDRATVSFYKPEIDNSRGTNSRDFSSGSIQDERVRNRVESRREVPFETRGRVPDNSSIPESVQSLNRNEDGNRRSIPDNVKTFEQSQQLERDKQDRSFQNFKNEREGIKRDQPEMNQRMTKPVERQNDNRPDQNYQRQREQFNKPSPAAPGNTSQRTPDRQPQRTQSVERERSPQFNRSNSQQERSTFKPADTNRGSTSQPQREQQIRTNSDTPHLSQPSRSVGERKPSPSRGR